MYSLALNLFPEVRPGLDWPTKYLNTNQRLSFTVEEQGKEMDTPKKDLEVVGPKEYLIFSELSMHSWSI